MKIAIFGSGYVGLVTGTCFAEMGNDVICVDTDKKKIENLNQGILPIYEPGLEEMVKRNYKERRIAFTTDAKRAVSESDLLFIAVGTPSGEDGRADLQYVLSVATEIGRNINSYKVVINKSTVPVGTGKLVRDAVQKALDGRGAKVEFDVVSNPEFLKEGAAIDDFIRPDRIVVGVESERARTMMAALYEPFVRNGHPILFMDMLSSEMTKYAANAMLATKISFINEMSQLCERVGADVEKVRKGIGSDSRIGFHFIYPGLGYGGSCFPKDVKALLRTGQSSGEEMHILDAVEKVNQSQRKRYIERVLNHFGDSISGKRIALWGLAFKPGTDDLREAPAIDIAQALLSVGAEVVAYDPVAIENAKGIFDSSAKIRFVENQYDALEGVHALCLVTEWKSFREPNFEKMKALMSVPVIFDGRNQWDPDSLQNMGFTYHSIGRRSAGRLS